MTASANQTTASSALPQGAVLKGRYHITKVLGQGGFGITYRAYDMKTRTDVAVKELFPSSYVQRSTDTRTVTVIPKQIGSFGNLKASFVKEANTLTALQGRHGIVKLFHLFEENGTAYYVMELLIGEDLSCYLRRVGTMTWQQLTPVLRTVLSALECIHEVGLIHRDVSPDNIFLTSSGARLIDFGSVRACNSDHFTAHVKHSFAPWEQYLTHGKQGPWTDIYALCVTCYYALSGKLPPTSVERRTNDTFQPLNTLCPGVPADICQAIHKGMALSPQDRFQNVTQLRRALGLDDYATVSPAQSGLQCLGGCFKGRVWTLRQGVPLRIGRNPDCDVVYPPNFQGVSRVQCSVCRMPDGGLWVRDERSTYGTRLVSNGMSVQMTPGQWYSARDARICFGGHEEYIIK